MSVRFLLLLSVLLIPLIGVQAAEFTIHTQTHLQEPDFNIDLEPDELEVIPGERAAFDIVVTTTGGFTGTLKFDVLSVPPNCFYEIKPATGKLQLKIYTTENTPPGTYKVKIRASAEGKSRTAEATLIVSGGGGGAGPDFSIRLRPSTVSIDPGQTANFTIVLIPTGGFAETVHYTVSGLPPYSYQQMEVQSGTDIVLKVVTTANTPPGTYEITVTAEGGGKVRKATARIIVGGATTTTTTKQGGEGRGQGNLSISVLPQTLKVKPGGRGILTVRVYKEGEFKYPVTLRIGGLPSGVTASADINNTVPNFVSQVEVSVGQDVQPGSYKLTVTISGGDRSESRTITLLVEGEQPKTTVSGTTQQTSVPAQADFSIELVPSSISLQKGGSGSVAVTIRGNGLVQPVVLTVSGPPTLSFTFSPDNTLELGETASLMVRAGDEPGTYTVVVEGRSGSLIRTATLTVTVEAGESRCIIATVTYGEGSGVVEGLRNFRDGVVMSTYAGSRFLTVFNAFYYSWSPAVAGWLRSNEVARLAVRAAIAPLIAILWAASYLTSFLPVSELTVVSVGLVSSFLIGLVYLGLPLSLLGSLGRRRLLLVGSAAAASSAGMLVSWLLRWDVLMQVSSSSAVISFVALGALAGPVMRKLLARA